jgi:DNA-binding CsgD family transcriptional regulator
MISAEKMLSKGIEFFVLQGKIFMVQSGQTIAYEDFSPQTFDLLKAIMVKCTAWKEYSRKYEDPFAEFIANNFANFDNESDVDEDGNAHFEKHEHLSRMELEYIKLSTEDLADKQIADRMHIRLNTVTTYRQRIANKLHLASKVGIAIWAIEKGLI